MAVICAIVVLAVYLLRLRKKGSIDMLVFPFYLQVQWVYTNLSGCIYDFSCIIRGCTAKKIT